MEKSDTEPKKKPITDIYDDPNKQDRVKTPTQNLGKPMDGSYLKKTIDMKWKIKV